MKICIVKLSAMGDIIHTMVALQFLKKQFPSFEIDWIVEDSFKGILENNPDISNVLPINLKSIKKSKFNIFEQIKLLNQYAKNNYDIVIDAQGLIKSAIVSKLVGGRVVGSKIVGFDKDSIREKPASWFYDETVSISYEKNVIDRNIKVICNPFKIKVTKDDILNKNRFLFFKDTKVLENDYIVFVIGASKENKIYPKEKFKEVANKLDRSIVVVWGNDDEKQTAKYLENSCKNVTIAPALSIDSLKAVVNNAKLLVGGDTGPTHMAWGLNIPSITIFGNTPENRNTYITEINKVIKSNSKVDALNLDKNDFSIKEINSDEIVSLAKEFL